MFTVQNTTFYSAQLQSTPTAARTAAEAAKENAKSLADYAKENARILAEYNRVVQPVLDRQKVVVKEAPPTFTPSVAGNGFGNMTFGQKVQVADSIANYNEYAKNFGITNIQGGVANNPNTVIKNVGPYVNPVYAAAAKLAADREANIAAAAKFAADREAAFTAFNDAIMRSIYNDSIGSISIGNALVANAIATNANPSNPYANLIKPTVPAGSAPAPASLPYGSANVARPDANTVNSKAQSAIYAAVAPDIASLKAAARATAAALAKGLADAKAAARAAKAAKGIKPLRGNKGSTPGSKKPLTKLKK